MYQYDTFPDKPLANKVEFLHGASKLSQAIIVSTGLDLFYMGFIPKYYQTI